MWWLHSWKMMCTTCGTSTSSSRQKTCQNVDWASTATPTMGDPPHPMAGGMATHCAVAHRGQCTPMPMPGAWSRPCRTPTPPATLSAPVTAWNHTPRRRPQHLRRPSPAQGWSPTRRLLMHCGNHAGGCSRRRSWGGRCWRTWKGVSSGASKCWRRSCLPSFPSWSLNGPGAPTRHAALLLRSSASAACVRVGTPRTSGQPLRQRPLPRPWRAAPCRRWWPPKGASRRLVPCVRRPSC
mmetsp:Transcript_77722/g.137008  ORF Transcript_77722/g.137008 Transcript_77722/m.137008 type:complete len:238 (-) Transcript_77722:359-1072(-)